MTKERPKFTSEQASKAGSKSKRIPFDKRMQEWLQEFDEDGVTVEEALRKALVKYGKKGNVKAIEVAFDRAYGNAKQSVDLKHRGEVKSPIADALRELRGKK